MTVISVRKRHDAIRDHQTGRMVPPKAVGGRYISGRRLQFSPVLTTSVSAVLVLFATVRPRPRSAPSRQNRLQRRERREAVLTGRNGTGRARTVANRVGTALTGAVWTGFYTQITAAVWPCPDRLQSRLMAADLGTDIPARLIPPWTVCQTCQSLTDRAVHGQGHR